MSDNRMRILTGLFVLAACSSSATAGSLYVSDASYFTVTMFDSTTGSLTGTLTPTGGWGNPSGIAVGPDGDVLRRRRLQQRRGSLQRRRRVPGHIRFFGSVGAKRVGVRSGWLPLRRQLGHWQRQLHCAFRFQRKPRRWDSLCSEHYRSVRPPSDRLWTGWEPVHRGLLERRSG